MSSKFHKLTGTRIQEDPLPHPPDTKKDKRAGMRAAKERKRLKLLSFVEARQRIDDITGADDVEETMNAEERAFDRKRKRVKRRWAIINRHTRGRKCPQCKQVVLNVSSWVILFKKRIVLCKSCHYRNLSNPRRETEMKMNVQIFTKLNRYELSPNHLIQARNEAVLTQAEFARLAGWTRSYQSRLETGISKTVSEETRNVILEVLKRAGISTEDS